MPKISALPTDTAVDGADLVPFVDVSQGRTEAITATNLATSPAFAAHYAPSVLNEADFASNSATRPPSQQSVAEYAAASFVPLGAFVKPATSRALPYLTGDRETTTGDPTLDQMVLWALPVARPVAVDQFSFAISTGAASATPRIGLYAPAANGYPGSLIVDAGTVDASTSGTKTIDLGSPVNITSGLVYIAIAWQGAVSGLRFSRMRRSGSGVQGAVPLPTTPANLIAGSGVMLSEGSVSGALPATFGGATTPLAGDIPAAFAIRVSALL